MIKFTTYLYLIESGQAVDAFSKASAYLRSTWDLSNPRGYAARFADGLDKFAKAAAAKEIYNGPFKDIYSFEVSRGLENTWNALRDKYREQLKAIPGDRDFWGVNMQNVAKAAAFYAKHNTPAEVTQWLQVMADIPAAIKVLKTYIKSGRPPKVDAQVKPIDQAKAAVASTGAHNIDPAPLLNDAVATFKAELTTDTQKSFARTFDSIKHAKLASELPKDAGAKSLATRVFITRHRYIDGKKVLTLELKPDAEMIVHKLANEMVENIVGEFVHKNTKKLTLIFKKKGGPTEHRIVRTNIRNNTLENVMFFKFADGSSFNIESTVVIKFTQTGKPYAQMPTRFRNVVMADGSKMSQPSEEKMLRTF